MGDLRFRAPVPLKGHSKHLNTGSVGSICPQPASLFSNPALVQWISAYIQGTMLDYDQLEQEYANRSSPASSSDPRVTEDCLFLDVVVPKKIFDRRGTGSGAPVLVWIHGGGYVVGEKTGFGRYNPAGMIQASRDAGDNGFIFVAINYRVSHVLPHAHNLCLDQISESLTMSYSSVHSVSWLDQLYRRMEHQMRDSSTSERHWTG